MLSRVIYTQTHIYVHENRQRDTFADIHRQRHKHRDTTLKVLTVRSNKFTEKNASARAFRGI